VTDKKNIKNIKVEEKEKRRSLRLKRLESKLKSNILKRKMAQKNNG